MLAGGASHWRPSQINNLQPGLLFFPAAIQVNELGLFFKLVKSSIGKLKMKGNPKFQSGATLPKFFVWILNRKSFGDITSWLTPSSIIPFSKYWKYLPSLVWIVDLPLVQWWTETQGRNDYHDKLRITHIHWKFYPAIPAKSGDHPVCAIHRPSQWRQRMTWKTTSDVDLHFMVEVPNFNGHYSRMYSVPTTGTLCATP